MSEAEKLAVGMHRKSSGAQTGAVAKTWQGNENWMQRTWLKATPMRLKLPVFKSK